ncbi:MAG TPA: NUDIX domain-containing protein [Thermoanaerobaculia bacterium]|nr:NUDIX domain-containing protein [Thermoanaerobaculia bacterium]
MTDWREVPVFGNAPKETSAKVRPSAYALIENDRGQFAIVRTKEGTYLPGGGIDAGETPGEAVIRETLEECGLSVRIGSLIAEAVQFAWSEAEETYFEKRSTFVDAEVLGPDTSRLEADHEVLWVDAETACTMLTHESHAWAVRRRTG